MSVREGQAGAAGSEAGERRGNAGQRVHFEALVAMADAGGGSGFEAESMDVSPEGMRLRTAYLPKIGEKLVCRFENGGSEMVVEGEVIWRNEAPRGGEFGLRFTDLDRETAEALRGLCVPVDAPADGQNAQGGGGSARGTRVRLHIEGLGSPMKARVRESITGEVRVGSNLEFLRVGRSVELEDMDHGVRREAHIDDVKVEIESGTNIPQLVVSLRYEDAEKKAQGSAGKGGLMAKAKAAAAAIVTPKAKSRGDEGAAETTRERKAEDRSDDAKRADSGSDRSRRSSGRIEAAHDDATTSAEGEDLADDHDDDEDTEQHGRGDKLIGIGSKAASAGKAALGKVGPALSAVSAKTKSAMAGIAAALQKKRAESADAKKEAAPRRMTAPPPTGALRAEGRKVIRDENETVEEAMTPEPPRANKKAAVVGSALGLVAVLALFGVTRFIGLHKAQEATTPDAQTTTAMALPSGAPTTAAAAAAAPAIAGSGTITAEVPLFGATPLSTTELVPVMPPTDPSALAAAAPSMPGGPSDPAAAPGAGSQDPTAEEGDEGGGGGGESGPAAHATSKKEWGTGGVHNPVVLKLKMDGPIESVNGAAGAMGFTVSLPDRRSVSAASELARKDKRIASLQVVNNAHGAEVTVQFKDGVPPYLVKAKGDRLEIALGTEGHKKVASKGSHKKKSATASAKKKGSSGKSAKKKGSKKG